MNDLKATYRWGDKITYPVESLLDLISDEDVIEVVNMKTGEKLKPVKKMAKAISLGIYENKRGSNCSNGGISERFDSVLIVHEAGWIDVDLNEPPENLCKLVERNLGFTVYKHIEPVKAVEAGNVGYMAGGCLVYSCDSRFRELSEYPLSLHDRQESQELNDLLSR